MAALLSRFVASFDAIKPVPNLTGLDGEFNQLEGASGVLNGGTTAFKLLIKTSDGSDPPVDADQIGAGPLARFKQNGTTKLTITNGGLLNPASSAVNTGFNADLLDGIEGAAFAQLATAKANFAVCFFEADPSSGTLSTEDRPAFVFPNGTGMKVTRVHGYYSAGSHTAGGSVTFTFSRRGSVTGDIGTITLDNTNNTINTVYTNDIADLNFSGFDTVTYRISARSGTVSERSVTLCVEGFQLLTG